MASESATIGKLHKRKKSNRVAFGKSARKGRKPKRRV